MIFLVTELKFDLMIIASIFLKFKTWSVIYELRAGIPNKIKINLLIHAITFKN